MNCKPISFAWDKTIPNGHCLDLAVIYVSLSGIRTLTETSVWINVECSIGIFCACLPSLRSLIRRILPGSKQSTNTARSRNPRSSLRLPDHESTLKRGAVISTKPFDGAMPPLPSPDENDGSGASRRHRTWYSSVVPARTCSGEGESMEEMMPIRKAGSKVDTSV
ncbi:hypothetical protein MMC22_005567 [Lobaria immixta]|nr:hypothetical protein [Lobaria immixta]